MRLSTRAEYGLRICFLLALSGGTTPLSVLVRQSSLSEKYLEQLLRMLKKAGLVQSSRGINGGYCLTRAPKEITMSEMLAALDDSFEFAACVKDGCGDNYCPNRRFFLRLYEGINDVLNANTLQDMLDDNSCKVEK